MVLATLGMRKSLKLLALTCSLLTVSVAALAQSNPLLGQWQAKDANNRALKGTFDFKADHTMKMHPEGQPEFDGTWEVAEKELILTIPEAGTARMQYGVTPRLLTLTYDNGNVQHFTKVVKSQKPQKKTPSK